MDRIRVVGGTELNGSIPISGAKNAALPLMIASLLTPETLVLENVPRLSDVRMLKRILGNHGVDVTVSGKRAGESTEDGEVVRLSAANIVDTFAPYELVSQMRASFWVVAPLLGRMGGRRFRCPAVAPSAPGRSISCSWRWSASVPISRSRRAMSSPPHPMASRARKSFSRR